MTTQALLTVVFGFGVVTLATVALLNVAGHRLHELQLLNKRDRDFAFMYTYSSERAAKLRVSFSRLPLWLGGAAVVVVSLTYGLVFLSEASPKSQVQVKATDEVVYPSIVDQITWAAVGAYVLTLVGITSVLSARLYRVLRTFNSMPFPNQAVLYRGTLKLSEDGPESPRTFRYAGDVRAIPHE